MQQQKYWEVKSNMLKRKIDMPFYIDAVSYVVGTLVGLVTMVIVFVIIEIIIK
jgi:hypothetical protein